MMDHSKLSLARRLKLQQLVIFEKVVETGSILAASRELHMTQPAVSKSIQELEGQFQQALLLRSKRGVTLTEFGILLLRHAQQLTAELRFLADDVNAWTTGVSGRVIVGTLIAASARLLPLAILRMRETAPNVIVQVRVGSNDVLFPDLMRGQVDVVVGLLPSSPVTAGDGGPLDLIHVPLYDETLCAVVACHHCLATEAVINAPSLQGMEWIVPTPESAATHPAHAFFKAAKLEMPTRVIESVSVLTNLGLLMESSLVGLMPQSVAEHFVHAGLLRILPLGVASAFGKVGYTLHADRSPSAAAQRLIAALRDVGSASAFGL